MKTILKPAFAACKQCFCKAGVYIYIVLGALILTSEALSDVLQVTLSGASSSNLYSFAFMLQMMLSFTIFPFIFPPLCALAGSLGFYSDFAHNYYRGICTRISTRDYLLGRIFSSGFIGGVCGMSMILLSGLLLNCFYPLHTAGIAGLGALTDPAASILGGWGFVFKVGICYFFAGMAISLVGLAVSALTLNRYVAVLAPLLLYTILHFLLSFLGAQVTPLNLLMTYQGGALPLPLSVILFLLASAAAGLWFQIAAKRRIQGE